MRTILSIYLHDFLNFSETTAAALFHAFAALCYFTPVVGAMIADGLLGKFKTILYISMIYAAGQIVLTFGAIDYGSVTTSRYFKYC